MKNSQQQILSEIKSLMASIKTQLEELESKIAEYEQCVDIQEVEEEIPVEEVVVEEIEEDVMDIELEPSDDLPFYDDLPVSEPELESDTVIEDIPADEDIPEEICEQQTELEVVTEAEVEYLPEPEPEQVAEPDQVAQPTPAPVPVIDAMIAKQPWRTDMPGSPVRDIRSAISLNDRILFINYLFHEDPLAFQEMLTQLNAMSSFDEAAAYAIAAHPEWDLESDTVYRFMMALRRRHQ